MSIARPDPSASADAIVVLGRGPDYTKYRTDAAIQLWNAGKAPHIFISGILDAPVIIELATNRGIPAVSISGESCSRSTWENAFYSELLMPNQVASSPKPTILLITDELHIARATLIFRSFGFEVIPHPVKADFSMWREHIFREFFVLIYYAVSGRLQPPTNEDYQMATTDAQSRIPRRQCILAQE
ncbi:YdcF family protein [Leptothoe spongobia]|nr:YdcF family protein [Leptothoe spongobia]